MHRGDLRAMPRHADESHEAFRASLEQRFERAVRSQGSLPFCLLDQVVHLDQIDLINLQAFERTMETRACALVGPIASLGRQEKVSAMLAHPKADSQFRIAIGGCGVDMINAVFEQELKY